MNGYRKVLTNRNFALLLAGQIISWLGDAAYFIALLWLVQELTGSRAMMGLVAACRTLPSLLGIVAGALIDRWDRRRVMIVADIVRAALIAIVPLLWVTGHLQPWQLPVIAALLGTAAIFFVPARQALVPTIVGKDDLAPANSLMQLAGQLVTAVGFASGGVIIGLFGMMPLFVFDSISFLVSAASILMMAVPATAAASAPSAAAPGAAKSRLTDEMRAGLRYIGSNTVLSKVLPIALGANFAIVPLFVLLPSWVKDVLHAGPQVYGFLQTANLVGLIVGSLLAVPLMKRFKHSLLIFGVFTVQGCFLLALAATRTPAASFAALAGFGLMDAIINITLWTQIQQTIPKQMMGRVFGSVEAISQLLSPTGQALGGVIAQFVALPLLYAVIACLRLVGAAVGWFTPGLIREIDRMQPGVADQAAQPETSPAA